MSKVARKAMANAEREARLAAMRDGRRLHGRGGKHRSEKDYDRRARRGGKHRNDRGW